MKRYVGPAVLTLLMELLGPDTSRALEPGEVVLTEHSEQAAFQLVSLVEDLDFAWDIEFLPTGELLLSEYDGRLVVVEKGKTPRVLPAVAETTEEGGLRGIAAHPDFVSNRWLYFCYAHGTSASNRTRIARARFDGESVTGFDVLFEADNPSHELAHYGCRLLWARDGALFATLGDRRHHPREAQDLTNHYGVILRLDETGAPARGNPFDTTPGLRHEIWAYGLRNVQGADFRPGTDELWVSEHGPYGGDEVNLVRAGRNYGWPIATFGIDYDGSILTETPRRPEVEPPLFYWYPSVAPSSLAFYDGDRFRKWRGDLFMGTLMTKRLFRFEIEGDRIIRQEELLGELDARIRDVAIGPDGLVYVLTDTGDGRLLRLEPLE